MFAHSLRLFRSNIRSSQDLLKKASISTGSKLLKDHEDISYEELTQKIMNKEVTLIDVRSINEVKATGVLPGAIVLPLPEFGDLMSLPPQLFEARIGHSKPPLSSPLVTMCLAGIRAKTAQMALLGAGYEDVRVYRGSFKEWQEKEGEIVSFD